MYYPIWSSQAFLPTSKDNLLNNQLHIWRTYLSPNYKHNDFLLRLLSPDEEQRARRYRFGLDQARFVIGRGVLRILLARYLGRHPKEIEFSYNAYGRPELSGACGLKFSVSHDADLCVYVISSGLSIGIDIEKVRLGSRHENLARHVLSTTELGEYTRTIGRAGRAAVFFGYWTRKEAYLKACGTGLIDKLNVLDCARLPQPLILMQFCPAARFVGSVCFNRCQSQVSLWRWREFPGSRGLLGVSNS